MANAKKRKIFISLKPRMFRYFDWVLLLCMLVLIAIGIMSIAAATATPITDPNLSLSQILSSQSLYYPRLQLIWTGLGLIVGIMVLFINYKFVSSKSIWIYWLNILLLAAVLLLGRRSRGNMAGWFRFYERTFQPSEIAKLAIIIGLADYFAKLKKPLGSIKEMLVVLAYVGLPLVLIVLQPDFGTASVYVFIFACMLFMSGAKLKPLFELAGIGILLVLIAGFIMVRTGNDNFRMERILVWLQSDNLSADSTHQTKNALMAVGSGGLTGKGLYAVGAMGQLGYIPDDHTDFVFSITCETFGFAGAFIVIAMYAIMFIRMLVLSRKVDDKFASMLIIGVMAMLLFHTFENIGMVIGVTPVTGIPLPFMSYGGSSLLTNIISIFVVLNVSMVTQYRQELRRQKQERAVMQHAIDMGRSPA